MSEYENENFINSTLQVEIKSFSEKTVNQKLSTYFDIQMQFLYTKKTWLLEKDYDDFVNLQNELNSVLPNPPDIGGKSLFKVKAYEGLTKRKNNLEKFLRECCLRKDIINTDAFQLFVDLKNNAPQLICEKPKLISEFNDLPLGIRDFIYLISSAKIISDLEQSLIFKEGESPLGFYTPLAICLSSAASVLTAGSKSARTAATASPSKNFFIILPL